MGQKIHPLGFRLGVTQKHRSQWFAKPKEYPQLVLEDLYLRTQIEKRFVNNGIIDILIQRKVDRSQLEIEIRTTSPGLIVGRKRQNGNKLNELRDELQVGFNKFRMQFNKQTAQSKVTSIPPAKIAIVVTTVKNTSSEAIVVAEFLVTQLEQRIAFRRSLRRVLSIIKRDRVQGAKIQISGRLNGAEIARTEWIRTGRVPLQTLRADVDYCYRVAKTIYGILGIKIWTYKGEIKPKQKNTTVKTAVILDS
uniref:Small ribosomal subunit protein uS3c n=1 Tax=Neodangemannia microcystis TaxID=173495 RepID=A0A1W6EHB7_9CHLO|nr:ribosomal protein S3 [Neodangemannia microcystis]ARK14791.1 ribosomal protein S3 [Neodangemannia microcystis]